MELAKITSKGQITIPKQIREKLNLKEGGKVVFITEGDKVFVENSTKIALKKACQDFEGLAKELVLETEEDLVNLVREVRQELQEKK